MKEYQHPDTWAAGDLYEPFMGRWSRLAARFFVQWLAASPEIDWLDIGCGTGALTQAVLDDGHPRSVAGVDPSPGFVAYASTHITGGRTGFTVGNAQLLPFRTNTFGATVSGLVLNFLPQPAQAVSEMARVTRPGGIVAAYVWDYAEKMEFLRIFWDVVAELDPDAAGLDEGQRFSLSRPKALVEILTRSGLENVDVQPIDFPTIFSDFDDYWSPFLGGQGPAAGYVMSIDQTRRNRLRERIHSRLPIAEDGSIPLVARAWGVRGHPGRAEE
jgi:SAM-dependent methyltransferase